MFVCLLFIGHTTFVHFAALPSSTPRAAKPSRAAPHARWQACTAREHARACRTTSQRKNRCADAFQKQNRTHAHTVVYVTAEIFKKGKKKTNMPLPKFSLQFAFPWSVYFSNRTESYSSQIEFPGHYWQEETSYLIFGRSRPWSARITISDNVTITTANTKLIRQCYNRYIPVLVFCTMKHSTLLWNIMKCKTIYIQEVPFRFTQECSIYIRSRAVHI